MSDDLMAAIKANQRVIWLSKETVSKQLRNRREVTANDYRIIPDLIDLGKVTQDDDRILVSFDLGNRLYKLVIQTKESGGGNFLTSFIVSQNMIEQHP